MIRPASSVLLTRRRDPAEPANSRARSRARDLVSDLGGRAQSAVSRLGGWLDPLGRAVSPLGWIAMGGAVLCGAVGLSQGWAEFLSLSVMLAVVAGVSLLFTFGRWNYEASIDLESRRVHIGDRVLGQVVVHNGDRPSAGTTIHLPVGINAARFRVPRLGAHETFEQGFSVPTRRRAVITVGPVRSVRGDPLGLFHRSRTWTEPVELYVHPDTVRLDSRATGFLKDIEGVTTQKLSSSDVSFHALRDYVPGDDRRSVHWRTTARVGRLMVRQFEETMRSHLLLVLSLQPDDYTDRADFELAVSAVGSLGRAALQEEREVSVFTSAGRLDFPSGPGLLDALCRVELDERARPLRHVVAEASARVPAASVAAIVSGTATQPTDLRSAQVMLPAEVSTFAVRCGRGASPARRKTSGLTVLDVGTLTDLQRGMRTLG